MKEGVLLRIEHASIHDGEGIQTVVFLKGCPLRCLWCSTPESQQMQPQTTPNKRYGEMTTVEKLMEEIEKDQIFFFHSGGGVTFSGGEPLMQAPFVLEIMKRCHKIGIPVTMETSMDADFSTIEPLLDGLHLLYTDVKHMDDKRHKELTGVGNERILSNIRAASANPGGPKLVIRMPVIPTINDEAENLRSLGLFCKSLPKLDRLELLPYHRLGTIAYENLGWEYALSEIEVPTRDFMEEKAAIVRDAAPELQVYVK